MVNVGTRGRFKGTLSPTNRRGLHTSGDVKVYMADVQFFDKETLEWIPFRKYVWLVEDTFKSVTPNRRLANITKIDVEFYATCREYLGIDKDCKQITKYGLVNIRNVVHKRTYKAKSKSTK